jgi:hypothetical protein
MNNRARQEQLKQRLTHQRSILLNLLTNLDEAGWQTAVFPDDVDIDPPWTVADLVSHLADAEQSMTRLMAQIRAGGAGAPADFDVNRWNNSRRAQNSHKSPAARLQDLANSRTALFEFIDSLSAADLAKAGRHGNLKVMNIDQICILIAGHDKLHTADIKRTMDGGQ